MSFSIQEEKGGRGWRSVHQEDFSAFVTNNGLVNIPFKQVNSQGRPSFINIIERLDRFILGGSNTG